MRLFSVLILGVVVCACTSFAQVGTGDPVISQAKARLEQVQKLVDAGAAPRAQLAQAQDAVADAEDDAVLRGTVYGQDLTEAQLDVMINAADRRYERRKKAFDETEQLVDAGVAPQAALDAKLEDLDSARKECDLAASRAKVVHDLAAMVRAEESLHERLLTAPLTTGEAGERFDGDGIFTPKTFAKVQAAFETHFRKPLPVSAMGETAVHRALGFDHTGRVDVAVSPDEPEGAWLRGYLSKNDIPYFAFRQAIPGKATGAHIHLGPQSTRLAHGG